MHAEAKSHPDVLFKTAFDKVWNEQSAGEEVEATLRLGFRGLSFRF